MADGSNYTVLLKAVIEKITQQQINNSAAGLMPITIKTKIDDTGLKETSKTISSVTSGYKVTEQTIKKINAEGEETITQIKTQKNLVGELTAEQKQQYQLYLLKGRQLKEEEKTQARIAAEIKKAANEQQRKAAASQKSATATEKAASAQKNIAKDLGNNVSKVMQWGIATSAVYGSLQEIRKALEYIVGLNKELTNIGLVTGQDQGQLTGMSGQFNAMAKELGATTLDMAEGATTWIRQGKSMADTMELLRVSTMLSKLGNLEASEATEKLTAVMNGYRLETSEAIKVTDTLIQLDNTLATSTQAIVDGMSKASSMANAAGVSYQNLATYIGVTQAVTQQAGDTVGQAYKTIFARFQQVKAGAKIFEQDGEIEDINNVEKALKSQDIAIRDSVGSFRELDDVLPEVAAKYKELMDAGRDVEAGQIMGAIAGKHRMPECMVTYRQSVILNFV